MGILSMQHPTQHQSHHSRPSSVVNQHHHPQAHPPPSQPPPSQQQQPQHQPAAYPSHSLSQQHYQPSGQHSTPAESLPSYYSHPSPYSTTSANGGYASADTSEMMAAAQMPRPPYPPMSYHTPQSNSPASVASPSQHDQHRSLYGQPPPPQHMAQSLYYPPQHPYQSMPPQTTASPYPQHAPHPQHPQHHPQHPQHQHPQPPMTTQPSMMMSHTAPHNPIAHHAPQHAQAPMNSPRPKLEPQVPLQLHKPQSSPMPPAHQAPNGAQLQSPGNPATGVNPNAAPGPIPATTPPVVRQDGNGVQWIAFEYSRDRVKMEYTIRCDVESVNTDDLTPEFKTENCVYPRACCPKDQYRGNRLMYETDCNRVGWALAHLNIPLRGKRGLIQRAVDSWRNSNSDPRLRSRRVRRMAKINTRKSVQSSPHAGPGPMPGPGAQSGLPPVPGHMGPGPMGKPGLAGMGQPLHAHPGAHPDAPGPGEEVGPAQHPSYPSPGAPQHQQAPPPPQPGSEDVRPAHVFTGYGAQGYQQALPPPVGAPGGMSHLPPSMAHHHQQHYGGATPAAAGKASPGSSSTATGRTHERAGAAGSTKDEAEDADDDDDLFPAVPEARKRKFILVEDTVRKSRMRVRVTLPGVDSNEIPDSYRRASSVFPRSYFPREMQSPGSHFFPGDVDEEVDDGAQETESRGVRGAKSTAMKVEVPAAEGKRREVAVPRMTRARRGREIKVNDLGHRLAWLQGRVFADRPVFLQQALDTYRTKSCAAVANAQVDVRTAAPHFELRSGRKRWMHRKRRTGRATSADEDD